MTATGRSHMPMAPLAPGPRGWLRTAALALASAAAVASLPAWADGKPVTHTIAMHATAYAPLDLTVQRGDTVVWVNKDPFPHTATAKGVFDSKSIAAGDSWKYKARKAGDYTYICTFHPNMVGTLHVK